MLEGYFRFYSPSGTIIPGGPSTWHICDWEQRRIIAVTMDEEQEDADVALGFLKQHLNSLSPDVCTIRLSAEGTIEEQSSEYKQTPPTCTWYLRLEDVEIPSSVKVTSRAALQECQRLTPNVDLVSCKAPKSECATIFVVFKYYFLYHFLHSTWHKWNLVARLPAHPNIVPFDSLVYDEPSGRIVGITTMYIPGGTINNDTSRVFKLAWLKQLTQVIDLLNFKHGIMHQDVAPRNLLVNAETNQLMLFDFDYAGRIGHASYSEERNDVKGVIFTLYETITQDEHYRMVPHPEQHPHVVENLEEWVQHPEVKLDHDGAEYRAVLGAWVEERREGKQILLFTEAEEPIDWPEPKIDFEDCVSLPWARPALESPS